MTILNNIHGKAILVSLSITSWAARKFDRVVTGEIRRQHNATNPGRFNKRLLGSKKTDANGAETTERNEYGRLKEVMNKARSDHYAQTLAWGNENWRLLPTANLDEYMKRERANKVEFSKCLRDFVLAYPSLRDVTQAALGDLFNEQDYPSVDTVEAKFTMDYSRQTLPVFGDETIDGLAAPQVEAIKAEMDGRIADSTEAAMSDARNRLGDVVRKMADAMNTKKGQAGFKFRNSKIENVKELVDVMSRLNPLGDSEFEAMRYRIERELTQYTPNEIREDKKTRKNLGDKADKIIADMGQLFGRTK
jgi:hypothetical protein